LLARMDSGLQMPSRSAKVENFSPAFSLKLSYQGKGLNRRFTDFGTRSAFLATFRR